MLTSNEKAQNPNVNVKDGSGGMLTYLLNSAAVVWTVDLDKAIGQKAASCYMGSLVAESHFSKQIIGFKANYGNDRM